MLAFEPLWLLLPIAWFHWIEYAGSKEGNSKMLFPVPKRTGLIAWPFWLFLLFWSSSDSLICTDSWVSGRIYGKTLVQSGGGSDVALPKVTITLIDEDRGIEKHSLETDSKGEYQFQNLHPGQYSIRVQKKGWQVVPRQEDRIRLNVNEPVQIRVPAFLLVREAVETFETLEP